VAGFLVPVLYALAPAQGQDLSSAGDARWEEFRNTLGFEPGTPGSSPPGWSGTQGALVLDAAVHHGGAQAARIEGQGPTTNIHQSIPIDFEGKRIELRGFLRTEDVSGIAGLWVRQDGAQPGLALDNMQVRRLSGTTGWAQYSVSAAIRSDATRVVFGAYLTGSGRIWVDDLELLVDGKPVWEAPRREIAERDIAAIR
jgi:hypothetical protein